MKYFTEDLELDCSEVNVVSDDKRLVFNTDKKDSQNLEEDLIFNSAEEMFEYLHRNNFV